MSKAVLLSPADAAKLKASALATAGQLPNRRMSAEVAGDGRMLVLVTSPSGISGATATVGGVSQTVRWTYTITQARLNASTKVAAAVSGGITASGVPNINENGNTSTRLSTGLVANVPAGFVYCAIGKVGDGSAIDTACFAYPEQLSDGTTSWVIDTENILDGTCA